MTATAPNTPTPSRRAPRALAKVLAHARWELGIYLRNGEQLLLMFAIPIGLLLLVKSTAVVVATATIAAAFTSMAISTGFERRHGALRFLGTTPLTRTQLLLGKALASLVMLGLSIALAAVVAELIGRLPALSLGGVLIALAATMLGVVAFASWGVLLAGTVRAEATLAIANGVFLLLIGIGGVAVPVSAMPDALANIVQLLPSAALVATLQSATGALTVLPWLVLAGWSALGIVLAARYFRWD